MQSNQRTEIVPKRHELLRKVLRVPPSWTPPKRSLRRSVPLSRPLSTHGDNIRFPVGQRMIHSFWDFFAFKSKLVEQSATKSVLITPDHSHLFLQPTYSKNPIWGFFLYGWNTFLYEKVTFPKYLGSDAPPQAWLEIIAGVIFARARRMTEPVHFC